LTGSVPYFGWDGVAVLSKIQAGKTPPRPSEGIPDPVWQLLEKCWSRNSQERPSATKIYNTFSKISSVRNAVEELPGKLKLQIQSIKLSLARLKGRQFSVRFQYGDKVHTTSLTTGITAGGEYTWYAPGSPPPLLLPLSLGQDPSGNLVDRNR